MPHKERLAAIRQQMKEQGVNALIHAKHLYHDREEITVHIAVLGRK